MLFDKFENIELKMKKKGDGDQQWLLLSYLTLNTRYMYTSGLQSLETKRKKEYLTDNVALGKISHNLYLYILL